MNARIELLLHVAAGRSTYHMRYDVASEDARKLALSRSRDIFFNFYNNWALIQNRRDPIPQAVGGGGAASPRQLTRR